MPLKQTFFFLNREVHISNELPKRYVVVKEMVNRLRCLVVCGRQILMLHKWAMKVHKTAYSEMSP